MQNITFRSSDFFDSLPESSFLHVVLIATKPDIIKQVPLFKELQKRGHSAILVHTGQHYDQNLSGGMLAEFGVEPDVNLNVRGSMYQVVSQIIERFGDLLEELKKRGKTVIPYVHGDTTTAMAVSNAAYSCGFSSVHIEAGIRTLTPKYHDSPLHASLQTTNYKLQTSQDTIAEWRTFLMQKENWERGSQEPFPEQFNTRCAEAATGLHLAPVPLVEEFLRDEGYASDRVVVVGNSVVDATKEALSRAKDSTIFEKYPLLQGGNFARFCIHRRENCLSEKRFRAIYDAMKSLVLSGRNVLLISMIQTNLAFERFGLKADVEELAKNNPHFLFSPVWEEYGDVIAAMSRASVCVTDSGSMQEEMNALGVPCVTLRFGSDRSESCMAGGNIIAPPVNVSLIQAMIEYAWDNSEMRNAPKIYGENVSAKCVDAVEKVLASGSITRSEEERLGFAS
jgi:UDP-N-acetylglucosamine 2-epimerase (non-hydrolysing)